MLDFAKGGIPFKEGWKLHTGATCVVYIAIAEGVPTIERLEMPS
jgi:hypothetical protein